MSTPNRIAIALTASFLFYAVPALAIDHNNLDAGHPLDFDDATPAAFREKAVEMSASFVKPGSGRSSLRADVDYLYGFSPDSHLTVSLNPALAASGSGKRQAEFGDVGLGLFHNFNREFGNTPAFSLRADATLPTGRASAGFDFRLRAIASRHFRQYGKLHLNLDLAVDNAPSSSARRLQPGILLGYSHPLGYPTSFDQTLVAQAGYRANPQDDQSPIFDLGIGLRRQVTVRSVLDVGLSSDLTGGNSREKFRFTAGYSTQF